MMSASTTFSSRRNARSCSSRWISRVLRFAMAVAKVESARAYLHEAFDTAWQGALDGRTLDMADKARLQLASSHVPIAAAGPST